MNIKICWGLTYVEDEGMVLQCGYYVSVVHTPHFNVLSSVLS